MEISFFKYLGIDVRCIFLKRIYLLNILDMFIILIPSCKNLLPEVNVDKNPMEISFFSYLEIDVRWIFLKRIYLLSILDMFII